MTKVIKSNPFHANYFLNVYNMSSMYLNKILFKPKVECNPKVVLNSDICCMTCVGTMPRGKLSLQWSVIYYQLTFD